ITYTKINFVRTSVFFFSSRRRHTRSKRDWSSDVCSSDLVSCSQLLFRSAAAIGNLTHVNRIVQNILHKVGRKAGDRAILTDFLRSEERRVGKEGRCRWERFDDKEKEKEA